MLPFNEEFQNDTSKISKVWVEITLSDNTLLEYDEHRVKMNGLVRNTSTTVDGQFTVGAAVTGKMTVVLDNSDDALSPYDFRNATMIVWLGGILSDETQEKVNVGRYYIDEYSYDGSNVTLTAYDDMCKFDVPCGSTAFAFTSNTTIADLVGYAVSSSVANISLYNATLPGPSGYRITQAPEQWDTMTWHDVIAYCAQIMCCYAHIVYVPSPGSYKLKFEWYDMSQMNSNQYDGGTFDTTTTPYSDGADLDGGTFNPWNTGDVADGGAFGDRSGIHIVPAPYDLSVDTDDVQITGVSVTLDPADNINADSDTPAYTSTQGSSGYVIQLSGNPLIETTAHANAVCTYINTYLNGMRFRPLNASLVEDPSIEAGDVALITGRNGNTYACFLSHVTYTVNAATAVTCDAESTMQNLKGRYSSAQKTAAQTNTLIERIYEKAESNTETAMDTVLSSYAASMGLYPYQVSDGHGGTIYVYGNKSTLASSDIRWKFSAGALSVSTDYGRHWNAALGSNGVAVLNRLYAIGIDADYITTGSLRVTDSSNNTVFSADIDSKVVTIGGFSVSYSAIYNSKSSIDTAGNGIYIGTDGIRIGDSFKFYSAAGGENYFKIGDAYFQSQYAGSGLSVGASKFLVSTTYDTEDVGNIEFLISDAAFPAESYHAYIGMNTWGDLWICSKGDIHIIAGWSGDYDDIPAVQTGTGDIALGCSSYYKVS